MRWLWLAVLCVSICVVADTFGCYSATASDTGGAGNGGGSAGGGPLGGDGTGACDFGECMDPCMNVKCPAGEFCAYDGTCKPLPSCDAGTSCASCGDLASCATCNAKAFPSGWAAFQAAESCVLCKACFGTCGGAMAPGWMGGLLCSGAPPVTDSCDTGTCSECTTCATNLSATCAAAWTACMANADCVALLGALPMCPAPPASVDAGPG